MDAFVFVISTVFAMIIQTDGHGRLINPPGRSTMWRYGFETPVNTMDHQLSCGGFGVQYYKYGGKCGICGDPYGGPRPNEAGGLYATGTIARTYKQGSVIKVEVDVTVNHGGWFEFRLCPTNDPEKRATEECLDRYLLPDTTGATRLSFPPGMGVMTFILQLPKDLTCSQCVFQWKYNTASNVHCDKSKCCRGCGPQEQFYGCADVAITEGKPENTENKPVNTEHKPDNTEHKPDNTEHKPEVIVPPLQTKIPPPSWLPNGNQNHVLPDGIIQVPVDIKEPVEVKVNEDCKAKIFLRKFRADADTWCQEQCMEDSEKCPTDYCEKSCLKN